MNEEVQNCRGVVRDNFQKPLKMSQRDESNFKKATRCHICQKKYRDNDGPNEEPVEITAMLLVNIVVQLIKNAI